MLAHSLSLNTHDARRLQGFAQYGLIVASTVKFFKGVVAFVRSRAERVRMMRDVYIQFAFKFWLATSVTIMAIVLIMWQAKFSGDNQLQNAYDSVYFFFVWQPIYFWLTVAICVQFQVEAAVMRAVLRTTMSAVGATLGYCAMLNGTLAQNPYWICGIVVTVNGFFSMFCVVKPLRYSVFLANFTFNAVVVCQYYGCSPCDVPGDVQIYGGKVLSTMFGSIYAILVSWLIKPYYTSQKMLGLEYTVMTDSLSLISSTWKETARQGDDEDGTDGKEGKDGKDGKDGGEPHAPQKLVLDLETVDKLIDERLVAVHKEIENNTIEKGQFLLFTYLLLPTPPVVTLLVKRLERLGVYLREYAQIKTSSIGGITATDADAGSTSTEFQTFISAAQVLLEKCHVTSEKLLATIKANLLDATGRTELQATRVALSEDLKALEASLDAITEAFRDYDQNRKTRIREPELKQIARSRLVFLAFKEFFVITVLLAETEATVDRDVWHSEFSNWFGRRPV